MKSMASVTFNLFQKIFSLRSKKFTHQNEEKVNSFGSTLMEIQKILIWDDPLFSSCCVILVNIVFWLIIYLDFKFYGIIFTALLILTFKQLWFENAFRHFFKSSSSHNLVLESFDTFNERTVDRDTFLKKGLIMLKEFYEKAKCLRKSQPGTFCILTSVGFLLVGVIGKSLSNVTTFYILIMLIMTVPGVLNHFLPPHVYKSFTDLYFSSRNESYVNDNDDEVEPYLPDTNEEALELLRLAGDSEDVNKEHHVDPNDLLLERIGERICDATNIAEFIGSKSSIYPESVIMPSPESSLDYWDFDSKEKTELDKLESQGINFQSQHFDGDSSEEEFVRGLDLSEKISKKYKNNKAQQIEQNNSELTTADKKFLADPKQKNSTESCNESSSDTDSFELISEEDM